MKPFKPTQERSPQFASAWRARHFCGAESSFSLVHAPRSNGGFMRAGFAVERLLAPLAVYQSKSWTAQ
jgi:hypothetical protein